MIFIEKFQILEKKSFFFILFHLIFSSYYCSINLKRQSENSVLRPDTSSLVCHNLFVTRSEIYLFVLYMAGGGMIFINNLKFKKKISFCYITFNFLMLLLLHKTLKGSRNIQGFALIRVVLLIKVLK